MDKLSANLMGSMSIAKIFIDPEEFRELMFEADPIYRMPTQQNVVEKIEDGMRKKMVNNLEQIDCLSAI